MRNSQHISKYLLDAQKSNRERQLQATGHQDVSVSSQIDVANAASAQPYIVTVTNSAASIVTNVDIFGAFQYGGNAGFDASGNLVISTVTIASGIGNVSYRELLAQSQLQPFVVTLTYIYSLAGAAGQVFTPFTVNARSANGNQASKAIIPLLDPMQHQNGVSIVRQTYRIDGSTKLTFATVGASVSFQLQLFPAADINVSRGLNGEAVSKTYSAPALS